VERSVHVVAEDNILEGMRIITKTSQLRKLVSQPRFEKETSQIQILKHCGVSQSALSYSQVFKQRERKATLQNIQVFRHLNHTGLLWISSDLFRFKLTGNV
jgi:hypothetical protein